MEQEGPRAAGRIEHALFQRARDCRRDDPCRQPIRRVVLAQVVALVGIDQALVEALKHVDLDVAQAEANRLRGERAHQVDAASGEQRPVEEIGLDGTDDAFVRQEPTRQHLCRIADLQIEDARRDRLHEDGQIGVLEEQRVAADVVAVDLAQQSIPQVALQPHFGMVADLGPEPLEFRVRAAEGEAVAAEGERYRDRRRHHLGNGGEQRLEPAQQPLGVIDIDVVASDRCESAAIQRVGEQRRPVGGKTDGGPAGRAAAARVGQIIGHPGDHIALLAAKVALQLDDGGAPRHVDAPTVVDEVALVLQFAERGAEAFSQQFRDQAAQRLVSRPGGHRSDDVGQAISAPTVCHFSPPARWLHRCRRMHESLGCEHEIRTGRFVRARRCRTECVAGITAGGDPRTPGSDAGQARSDGNFPLARSAGCRARGEPLSTRHRNAR